MERSSFLQKLQYSSESAQRESHPSPVTVKGVELASSDSWVPMCGMGIFPHKYCFLANFQRERHKLSFFFFFFGSKLVQEIRLAQLGKNSAFTSLLKREVTMWFFVLFRTNQTCIQTDANEAVISGTDTNKGTNFCYLSRDIISSSVGKLLLKRYDTSVKAETEFFQCKEQASFF